MLPTNAKMTAFVCSGRSLPKVSHDVSKFSFHTASCVAMSRPTTMPMIPQNNDAHMNWRTTLSL